MMRRLLGALFFSVTSLSAFDYALKPERITSDVTCFFGAPEVMNKTNNGNIVNSCYIDAGEGYIVVDTGPSYAYAESAYNAMQRIKPLPVKLVINTHIHDDHWLGNGFFTQSGVSVVGSDDFLHNVNVHEATRMQNTISPAAYEGTVSTLPTEIISESTRKKVGNQDVELKIISRTAHTAKDLVVYLPKSGVLFAGDLVFNDRLPSVKGGNINGWITTLEELESMGALHVIGGHGRNTEKNSSKMTHEYLSQMRSEIHSAIESGLGIDETIKKVQMVEYRKYKLYDAMQSGNVEASYRVLEWE
jgi:glyoxylase-like metal-dependent hydrolase (beta-lactamase superfamily II)